MTMFDVSPLFVKIGEVFFKHVRNRRHEPPASYNNYFKLAVQKNVPSFLSYQKKELGTCLIRTLIFLIYNFDIRQFIFIFAFSL